MCRIILQIKKILIEHAASMWVTYILILKRHLQKCLSFLKFFYYEGFWLLQHRTHSYIFFMIFMFKHIFPIIAFEIKFEFLVKFMCTVILRRRPRIGRLQIEISCLIIQYMKKCNVIGWAGMCFIVIQFSYCQRFSVFLPHTHKH